MQDKLTEYGNAYQTKVIAILLKDPEYVHRVVDILDPEYFEGTTKSWVVSELLSYFKEYKRLPTLEVFKAQMLKQFPENEVMKTSIREELKKAWKEISSSDLEYIRESLLDFCKNQKLKAAILESVDLLKLGKYDKIKRNIDSALNVGIDNNLGYEYSDYESRYDEEHTRTIPTPWPLLNAKMKGGLGAGELGVIMAPPGVGKTWLLCALGAHAATCGFRVNHYTLELNDKYVGKRYDCIYTGIDLDHIDERKDEVFTQLDKDTSDLIVIKRYHPKGVSAFGIRAHVERSIILDKKPDLVVIDYADLLKLSSGEMRLALNEMYEELRAVAIDFDLPIWTASQVNRDGSTDEFIDGDKVAESYAKNNTADFILSASRPNNSRFLNRANYFIVKNRRGPDKLKLVGTIDTNSGNITIDDVLENSKRTEYDTQDGELNSAIKAQVKAKLYQLWGQKEVEEESA